MSVGIRNYPRKPLSERERTIREALSRFTVVSSPGSIDVCHSVSDQTTTSNALADATNLSFPLFNGVYYQFKFSLIVRTGTVTGGITVSLTTPTFTRYAGEIRSVWGENAMLTASGSSSTSPNFPVVSTDYLMTIEGAILPSADGSIQVRFASEDNASTISMRQGSCGQLVTL